MDIIQAIHSDKVFKSLFQDLGTWQNWLVCLKAIFGLSMDRKEWRIYKKFTGRSDRPSKQFSEGFLVVGRRGGKSFCTALTLVFLAVFKKWNLGIERGHILCIANDLDQAGVIFDYVKKILSLPAFKSMIVRETIDEIELTNNMVVRVKTCNYRSLRGYAICAAVLDELAFFRVEGANPAKEILTALRPSLGNIEGSLMLGISTSYSRSGPLWDIFDKTYGVNDPECLVWRASTSDMNPNYSKGVIKRALQEDHTAARAEYFSEFRADLETFLPLEIINAAIRTDRFQLSPGRGFRYFAFCDPSSGICDSMTLSISHIENEKIVQDCIVIKHPPFDPIMCIKEFASILKSYGIATVQGDRYASGYVESAFEKESIFYEQSPLIKSDIYLEALALFMQQRVVILDNPEMINELRTLERRTGKGKDSIDHGRGMHDDAVNSLCGSITMASRSEGVRTPPPSYGLTEPAETVQETMARKSRDWLLGRKKKKVKPNETEIDHEALERELMRGLEDEIDRKDTSQDVKFFKSW